MDVTDKVEARIDTTEVVNRKEVVSNVKTAHHSYQNGIATSKEVSQETDTVPSKNSQNTTGNKPGKDRDR